MKTLWRKLLTLGREEVPLPWRLLRNLGLYLVWLVGGLMLIGFLPPDSGCSKWGGCIWFLTIVVGPLWVIRDARRHMPLK